MILLLAALGGYLFREQQRGLEEAIRQSAGQTGALLAQELRTQVQLLTVLGESPRLDPPMQTDEFVRLAERLRSRIPLWEIIRVTDLDGTILASTPPREGVVGSPVIDRESHEQLSLTGKPVIGNLVRGRNGRWAFPVRVPVQRSGTVYVLSAVLRPESLAEYLYANGLQRGWEALILDGEGRVVAATGSTSLLLGSQGVLEPPTTQASSESFRVNVGSEPYEMGAASIGGTKWSVYVGLPLVQYQAPIGRAYRMLLLAGFVALLLSIFATWLAIRELASRREQDRVLSNNHRLEALGKLAGGIAHDFNNLLMSFQSGIEIIRRGTGGDERTERVSKLMLESVERGKNMSQRLLAFSRQSDHRREVFDLQARLDELRPVISQATRANINLAIEGSPEPWAVNVDPEALEIAMVNLVSNAKDAMPDGGTLSIQVKNIQDGKTISPALKGPFVSVSVSDTGSGISQADLHRVFDPFFTTKGAGFTGLGLSQVYGFAKRSGGVIEASSVPGRGSIFSLYLPRADAPASPEATLKAEAPLAGVVLVVDDTPSASRAAQMLLETEGCEVLLASNGDEALEQLNRQSRIQWVLCDVMMPGISGLDLAPLIRRNHPRLPIILMSGYNELIGKGVPSAFPLLRKPFDSQQLRRALASAEAECTRTATILQLKRG
ncbi:response regulator [Tianweitania sediminis]|uniref:histidine kinase n=1 Tax=Tianweitania sediminis TaxID=1502156 RepID=A0A8J7UI57_9HYPH|nr:response regulator [Tianweitania sediminis]MBP0437324.1 response regulator [Tianweitania sediminis]